MKLIIAPLCALIIVVGLCIGNNGCTTVTNTTTDTNGVTTTNITTTLDTNKVINALNAAVPPAVRLIVANKPQTRQYFQDVAAGINLFTSTSSTFDPSGLNAAIKSAVGSDAVDPDAFAAIDAGVAIFKAFYGDALTAKLNTPSWLLPVLRAFADDINAGLLPATQ